MNDIRAVLFDLDQTLLTGFEPALVAAEAVEEHAVRLFPTLTVKRFRDAYETVMDDRRRRGVREQKPPQETGLFWQMHETLLRLGIDQPGAASELTDTFLAVRTAGVELIDGCYETLDHVRQFARTGLVTNGWIPTRERALSKFDLVSRLDLIVISENVGFAKPAPEIFQIALDRLEVDPANAVMVGDSIENDVAGAHALGMRSVLIHPGDASPLIGQIKPDAVISQLSDLLDALRRI